MAIWTPENIKHSVWLDASNVDHFVFLSGTNISRWKDHLRNGHFFNGNLNSAFAPSRVAGVLNGYAAVRFDGVDDYLESQNTNALATDIPALAVFAVARDGGSDTQRTVANISTAESTTTPRARIAFRSGVVRAEGRRLDADTTQFVDIANPTVTAIVSGIFDYAGASLQVGVNGTYASREGGFQTAGNTSNTLPGRLTLGAEHNILGGFARLNGDIFEVVVLNFLPSTDIIQKIDGYLAHKYGLQNNLPIDHPYYSLAPEPSYGELNLNLFFTETFNYPNNTNITGLTKPTALGNIEYLSYYATPDIIVTDNEVLGDVTDYGDYFDSVLDIYFGNATAVYDGNTFTYSLYDYGGDGFYPNNPVRIEYDFYFPVNPTNLDYLSIELRVFDNILDGFNTYKRYRILKDFFDLSAFAVGLNTVSILCLLDGDSPGDFQLSWYFGSEISADDLPRLRAIRVYVQQSDLPSREIIDGGERFIYRAYLTATGEPDLELPISSLQARNRLATGGELTVVVPNPNPYLDAIQERRAGRLVVKTGFALPDGTEVLQEIAGGALDNFRYDLGSFNGSAALGGSGPFSPFAPITRKVRDISFRGMNNSGARRFRCAPDMYLQPGDTADLGDGESMVVDQVQFTVNANQATMEISEADLDG
jgi:hypothetical protein